MVEVARAADFALATLYQLFPSKDAILRGLLEEQVDRLLDRVRTAAEQPGDAAARLGAVVRAQLAFFAENPDVLRLYLSGWSGYDFTVRQDFGARIDTRYRQYLALLAAVLAHAMDDGRLRREAPERLALALAGMLNALIRAWMEDDDLDLAAEGEAMLRIFLDGVRTRRGHA